MDPDATSSEDEPLRLQRGAFGRHVHDLSTGAPSTSSSSLVDDRQDTEHAADDSDDEEEDNSYGFSASGTPNDLHDERVNKGFKEAEDEGREDAGDESFEEFEDVIPSVATPGKYSHGPRRPAKVTSEHRPFTESARHSKAPAGNGKQQSRKRHRPNVPLPPEKPAKMAKISKAQKSPKELISVEKTSKTCKTSKPTKSPKTVKSESADKTSKIAAAAKNKKKPQVKRKESEEQGGSSGDEYTSNLLENYIGQIGACAALGLRACDVLNMDMWVSLTEEERDSLRVHLPADLTSDECNDLLEKLFSGQSLSFGSPRDRIYDEVACGLTHPRVKRWRQRVNLIERRHHLASLREYHNRCVRRLSALKAPREGADDVLAHLALIGGGISKAGDALLALPERLETTAIAAGRSGINGWNAERWRRVLDFRIQETERYQVPERAFVFRNPWGSSIVSPLKRGPALDGGRPREHDLLRNERPSHVTILCIVRDAASRLRGNRGTRAEICDLLRDSQYLREGATFQQLNTVVSGALDRLHYEINAPVQYDAESKEWCYLHNHYGLDDFETPEWALHNSARVKASSVTNVVSASEAVRKASANAARSSHGKADLKLKRKKKRRR